MNNSEIRLLIDYAFRCNGVDAPCIRVKWSNRMTNTMGYAKRVGKEWILQFSRPIWNRATREQMKENVIHEACHVIAYVINKSASPHGNTWKNCMRKCGYKPNRCHSVSVGGLRKTYGYRCVNCDKAFNLSSNLHTKINKGQRRVCSSCLSRIEYVGETI